MFQVFLEEPEQKEKRAGQDRTVIQARMGQKENQEIPVLRAALAHRERREIEETVDQWDHQVRLVVLEIRVFLDPLAHRDRQVHLVQRVPLVIQVQMEALVSTV